MGVIRVLDASVADQIAAGEVVERPSSVVKELLENAVDAGATRVEVYVDDGGLGRLEVQDDGHGMEAEDAVLSVARYATSKLKSAEDLLRMNTFGFRGEALAAIGSVAKLTVTTRTQNDAAGFEVRVEGGRVVHVGAAAAAKGTRVSVRELFYNTPARRKFLKTARTEAAHVEDVIGAAALFLPHVAFRLFVDGKPTLDLPPVPKSAGLADAQRIDRVVRVLGKQVRSMLYPLDATSELLTLRGHIVAPLETRRDLWGVHLAVNGRPVADRALVQAVRAAFRTLLEVGRHPIVALDIGIDPGEVDVNVHPQKAEVRFADPRRVAGHVIALLSELLSTTPWLRAAEAGARSPSPRVFQFQEGASAPAAARDDDPHRDRIREALQRYSALSGGATAAVTHPPLGASTLASAPALPGVTTSAGTGGVPFSSLRVVGQVATTYLILEGPKGMVVIDQHAAHERVVFERLRRTRVLALEAGGAPSQPLLLPLQVDLSAAEMAALEDGGAAVLQQHGLVVDVFGENAALVRAVPPGLDGKKASQMTRDALGELSRGQSAQALSDRLDAVCARLACHAAIRAGDVLDEQEIRALLEQLDAIDLGAHCPHGRPVVRAIYAAEMAGWFDR